MTIDEYATYCRDTCPRPSQKGDGTPCGTQGDDNGETFYTFCAHHMAAVVGVD